MTKACERTVCQARSFSVLLGLLSLFLLAVFAQSQAVFMITAAQLQNSQAVELDKFGCKYTPSDDARFADPQFDARSWATLAESRTPG